MVTWDFSNAPVPAARIEEVERKFGISFPNDYLAVVRAHEGGYPEPQCFDLPGRKDAVFEHLISFWKEGEQTRAQGIDEVWEQLSIWLPSKVFPFGNDPFGNCLCFDFRDDPKNPQVVFFDFQEVSKENPDQALTFVANSFTEFLQLLH